MELELELIEFEAGQVALPGSDRIVQIFPEQEQLPGRGVRKIGSEDHRAEIDCGFGSRGCRCSEIDCDLVWKDSCFRYRSF